jgi:hypothetical protein
MSSDLLRNVERTMYTFNFNNIVEICFDKVIKFDKDKTAKRLDFNEKILFDNCIDKYLNSFHIVKDTSLDHIQKLINREN